MKQSILYLDDEGICLDVFRDTFKQNYDVRTVATSVEAHRLLSECPAEIVVSDQLMPGISGTEFLREVAERYPDSCRVLLTGTTMVGSVIREISEGIIHLFVRKPWFEQDMREALERASMYAELRRQAAWHRERGDDLSLRRDNQRKRLVIIGGKSVSKISGSSLF